jgi:colanic acid biosynthesis glycosyl transferase WcaI
MRILIHDYAGHAFPVSLSRELSKRGHIVSHSFASNLQTPRGALARRAGDPEGLQFEAIAMSPDYVKDKYSFIKRRSHEKAYGRAVARFIGEWTPDIVLSGNTPTETQGPIVDACGSAGIPFCYWVQDFYSLAVSKLVRKKLPVLGELIGAYYRNLDRQHLRRSAAVISITEDFNPQLIRWKIEADRRHVIPNWAELAAFPSTAKGNPWAKEQGLVSNL